MTLNKKIDFAEILKNLYKSNRAEAVTDKDIMEAFSNLSNSYEKMKTSAYNKVNYSSPQNRFAYVYKYVYAYSSWLHQILNIHKFDDLVFDRGEVKLGCIGVGPGTDLLGITSYLLSQNIDTTLNCTVYDREMEWKKTLNTIIREIKKHLQIKGKYHLFDGHNNNTWETLAYCENLDLITLNFCLSEFQNNTYTARRFLEHLFRKASPGTIFLYLDYSTKMNRVFDQAANQKIHMIQSVDDQCFSIELDPIFENYMNKFNGHSPKRKSEKVSYRIGQKL